MTSSKLAIHHYAGSMIVDLLPVAGTRVVTFEAVEILDFRRQLGAPVPSPFTSSDVPRWSYDEEMDAYYIRVREGTAGAQRSVVGTADLHEAGRVARLKIPT